MFYPISVGRLVTGVVFTVLHPERIETIVFGYILPNPFGLYPLHCWQSSLLSCGELLCLPIAEMIVERKHQDWFFLMFLESAHLFNF